MSTDAYELKAADFAPFAGPGWGELRGRNRVDCQVISYVSLGRSRLEKRAGGHELLPTRQRKSDLFDQQLHQSAL